jgi:penicillin-binding protein 2
MVKSPGKTEGVRSLKRRLQIMVVLATFGILVLVVRLFQLQVLEAEHFARQAEDNFIDTIEVEAPRGRLFDAKAKPLATNRPAYTMYVTAWPRVYVPSGDPEKPPEIQRVPITDDQIADLYELVKPDPADPEDKRKFFEKIQEVREDEAKGRYPVRVRSNLEWEQNARIQTREELVGWVEIRESARRFFPYKKVTAFVTGFMQEISRDQLEASTHGEYRIGDRVGKTGLERHWENYLRGRLGSHSRVVNNRGIEVMHPPEAGLAALPADRDPIPGQDIHLSIDLDLQQVAYEAFEGKNSGGVLAMEVESGRILAMVSVPATDPNDWEERITGEKYRAWLEDPLKPFVDKTVQENFFPGSTYKVVSALAALEDPSFDPDEVIECKGHIEYGGRRFNDTHRHGEVNLEQAIVQSCNVYFYQLAIDHGLNLSRMRDVALKLGLGERTGLGINGEVPGVVPTEASESRHGRFQRGVLLNSVIGQGNVKATVLQIAVLYSAIANGGYVMTPSLVDRIETYEGKVVFETQPQPKTTEPVIAHFDRERIHRGLVGVVNDERGTAFSERLATVRVAGKTGTAQVGRDTKRDEEVEIEGWDTTRDHAWFAGYAPADDPEVVVVAMVAHGGVGADAAAPIVMRVIEHYLGDRAADGKPRPRPPGVPPQLPGTQEQEKVEKVGL